MKNIEIRASPDAECIWHKVAMRDYRIRNKLEDGVPTFPKNHPCAMACNGYDFNCEDYDSLSLVKFRTSKHRHSFKYNLAIKLIEENEK